MCTHDNIVLRRNVSRCIGEKLDMHLQGFAPASASTEQMPQKPAEAAEAWLKQVHIMHAPTQSSHTAQHSQKPAA